MLHIGFAVLAQPLDGFNGGPHFKFSGAVSLKFGGPTKEESDRDWDALVYS